MASLQEGTDLASGLILERNADRIKYSCLEIPAEPEGLGDCKSQELQVQGLELQPATKQYVLNNCVDARAVLQQ